MKHKLMCLCVLLAIYLSAAPPTAASVFSQLKTLETAVNLTLERLQSGIQFEISEPGDFRETAGQQLQLALLGLDAADLLQEDYYHLSLYLIARHFKQYAVALELLEFEFQAAEFRGLKNWLAQRIDQIKKLAGQPASGKDELSVAEEFKSLRNLLKKHGIR